MSVGKSTSSIRIGMASCLRRKPEKSGTLRPLGAVLRAALAALGHASRVERTAHGVVTHARKILHATAANQNDRVLLQVVAFTADVADYFETIGQAHLGNLAQGRIRLLRRGRVHTRADAATLRAVFQRRRSALVRLCAPWLAHQLIDCRHSTIPERAALRPVRPK